MNADLNTRFEGMIRELDEEDLNLVMLLMFAVKRHDDQIVGALQVYRGIARQDDEVANCAIDYDLLTRIKSGCPEEEVLAWGRALTKCIMRGDERRAAALQEIMRRRVMH